METSSVKFRINFGEETRPMIENINFPLEKNYSLFNEQYKKVFEEIERFLNLKSDKSEKEGNCFLKQNESINNIMAFIGERGSGKTSCMLSVANSLINKDQSSFNKYKNIQKQTFHSIELIDPSFFDETNNILNIIIAKLFRKFKDKEERFCNNQDKNFDKKRLLIEMFQKVQTNLNCMISGKGMTDDDLEQLISLSAGVNLRTDIEKLVETYLDYMHNPDDILVIMVDDIDLNTHHAHIMAEQIRKYFIHPNIIILLAVKIDQLANVMKRQYVKEFDVLLKQKQMSFESVEEMVDRYLSKLIPHPQRIFLPDSETFLENSLSIIFPTEDGKDNCRSFSSIREAVPMLIFEKTRYLFYNSLGTTSYIVPRNLRELRHIINLLWNMENYSKDSKFEYNKVLFRKYFYETWVSNNLDVQGRELIKNILDITDAVLINKSVISLLKKRFDNIIKPIPDKNTPSSELILIIRDDNVTYNISVGDVMALIYYLENVTEKVEDQKLLFMIKSIYSIRLYQFYDQITEEQNPTISENKEVMKNNYLKGLSDYVKLASGNFINSACASLIPDSVGIGKRNQRRINGSLFYHLLNEVVDPNRQPDSIKLNLVEFFALTISRIEDTRAHYRTKPEVYYNTKLDNTNLKNLWFDITSFTYNLTFIEDSYSRFHENLYSICKNNPNSLYNKIKNAIIERYPDDEEHAWMSWICIRNAEVLQDFVLFLENNRPKGANSNLEVIKNFFLSASKFEIFSYDFTENSDEHYKISFPFLSKIAEALGSVDDQSFESLYAGISSNADIVQSYRAIPLNIRLNLRGSNYQKNTVWERLLNKNPWLSENQEYRNLFDELFTQEAGYFYSTLDVNVLLNHYKSRVESISIA